MYYICIIYLTCFLVSPSIIALMDQTVDEGNIASFTCQADGQPLPTISWYFNGAQLNESNTAKYMIAKRSMPHANADILTIRNVESSDVGTYTCIATNIISSDTSYGILTVNGELFAYSQSTRVIVSLNFPIQAIKH